MDDDSARARKSHDPMEDGCCNSRKYYGAALEHSTKENVQSPFIPHYACIDMVHCFRSSLRAPIHCAATVLWIFTKVGIGSSCHLVSHSRVLYCMIYRLVLGLLMTIASRSCLSVTSASSSAMMGER